MKGDLDWAELSPAFGQHGLRLRTSSISEQRNPLAEPEIEAQDQFAAKMDHIAARLQQGVAPYARARGLAGPAGGHAIYEPAKSGRSVKISSSAGPTPVAGPADERGAVHSAVLTALRKTTDCADL